MLNRAALIVRPREPFFAWAKGIEPNFEYSNDSDERTVYLIPAFEDDREFQRVLKAVWAEVFERELESWYTDESLWPKHRTLAMFKQWYTLEVHTVIEDLCDGPLTDDDY